MQIRKSTKRKLKLSAGIAGTGWNFTSWMHKDISADAGENVDFYIEQAKIAEDAEFETLRKPRTFKTFVQKNLMISSSKSTKFGY